MGPNKTSVIYLLRRLNDLIQNLNGILQKLNQGGLTPGLYQSLTKEKLYKTSKIKSTMYQIDRLISVDIIEVIFKDTNTNKRYKMLFSGLSNEDICGYLKLVLKQKGMNIKILEIKRINTRNSFTEL